MVKMKEETGKEISPHEFEGSQYLMRGDLVQIANILGTHERTVQRVFQGRANSDVIAVAIREMIKQRKKQIENGISEYLNK